MSDLAGYEVAILTRLSAFPRLLAHDIERIEETPLEGVWRVTLEGRPNKTVRDMIEGSGLLRSVGTYTLGQGEWAIHVRLVR